MPIVQNGCHAVSSYLTVVNADLKLSWMNQVKFLQTNDAPAPNPVSVDRPQYVTRREANNSSADIY